MGPGDEGKPPKESLSATVARLRKAGLSERAIEAYIVQRMGARVVESAAPAVPAAQSDASAVTPRKAPAHDEVGGFGAVAVDMALPYSDEIGGGSAAFGLDAASGFGLWGKRPNYGAMIDEFRQKRSAFESAHPDASMAAKVIGAAAPAAASMKLLPAAGMLEGGSEATASVGKQALAAGGRALKNAGVGGAMGAVYGSGAADNGGLAGRAEGGFKGGLFGALVGGGVSLGADAVGAGANWLGRNTAVGAARPVSDEGIVGGLNRLLGKPIRTMEDLAKQDVLVAMRQAGTDPSEIITAFRQGQRVDGTPLTGRETLAELIGGPTGPGARLARGTHAIPSEGSAQIDAQLKARARSQGKAVRGTLEEGAGQQRRNVLQTIEELDAERKATAGPMFQALDRHYGPTAIRDMDQFLDRPSMETAIKETEKILREQSRRAPGERFKPLLETVKLDTPQGVQEVTRLRPMTFEEWSLLKQSLDDVSDVANVPGPLDAGGVGKTRRGKMTDTRAEVLGLLDKTFVGDEAHGIPSYANARNTHAGTSANMRAAALGKKFRSMSRDEAEQAWRGLKTDSEREFFKLGALESYDEPLSKVTRGQNAAREFDSDMSDDRLRLLLGDKAEPTIGKLGAFGDEAEFDAFVRKGSPTARITEETADLHDIPASVGPVAQAVMGRPGALVERALNSSVTRAARGLTRARADARAPLLMATSPETERFLQLLQDYLVQEANRKGGGRFVAPVARGAGLLAGKENPR